MDKVDNGTAQAFSADAPAGLYVVATPVGNLGDISPRAVEILRTADGILAEDTRTTAVLLRHYGIRQRVHRWDSHREYQGGDGWISRLQAGERWVLVSDAGTPAIRDPGAHLVQQAHAAGIRVIPVPGPCAAIAALSASGMPGDAFVFVGFLPSPPAARRKQLAHLERETRTMVLYESPHRLDPVLHDMEQIWGSDRPITLCRELTKKFETIMRTTVGAICRYSESIQGVWKGEVVLVVAGYTPPVEMADPMESERQAEAYRVFDVLVSEDLREKQAIGLTARITGLPKNQIYQWIQARKREG